MRRLIVIAVVALMGVPESKGQTYCPRGGGPQYAYVQARPAVRQAAYAPATVQATQDGPAAFLALLNADRARIGRHAIGWDANLAAFAATNNAVHAPGSSGGAGQCWAQSRSYVQAYHMWRASPPHWAILAGASSAVGVSVCPSGITANAR